MLEPRERRLLIESLRPPFGYTLDCAIGTTFSLDLLALLTVPLAFTFFDWEGDVDGRAPDPLALLEAVRRHADRISIFCQAGHVYIPKGNQTLYGYLEGSVFEVVPPSPERVFHPKVWVLRFSAPSEPVLYRLLVLSRNLTFDRSWDVMLVLDGRLTERKYAFGANHPLGDFIAALPDMAIRPLSGGAKTIVDQVQAELRRVYFELPEGFEKVSFWPLGLRGRGSWPFGGRIDRMLVISPFVADSCLKRLTAVGEGHVLISRSEILDALERTCLEPFRRVWVLSEGADPEPLDDVETIDENAHVDTERDSDDVAPLAGLHAKAYVADAGWNARVWMGSANATHAAFDGNVEFLVELEGKKSRCGVDAVLDQTKDSIGLADLLREYVPPGEPIGGDPIQEQLEERVNSARRQLAQAGLVARVSRAKVAGEYRVSLRLSGDRALGLPPEIGIRCWPITLQEAAAADLVTNARGVVAIFGPLSFQALTSFFAFDLRLSESSRTASARFVLNLPLEGAPKDRRERILLSLLENREQVLRYLLLLLAEGGFDPHAALLRWHGGGGSGATGRAPLPLFEALVRALHRNPGKLDQVARLVDDLRKTPGGQELLPEGFEAVWQPIWSVRRGLKA